MIPITEKEYSKWEPCPFCGLQELYTDYEPIQNSHSIVCSYCGAQGPRFGTRDEAIVAWNDRTLSRKVT